MVFWMGRTALELIGQSGFGHSFDDLSEEYNEHCYSSALKLLVYASSLAPPSPSLFTNSTPPQSLPQSHLILTCPLTYLLPQTSSQNRHPRVQALGNNIPTHPCPAKTERSGGRTASDEFEHLSGEETSVDAGRGEGEGAGGEGERYSEYFE